MIIDVHGHVGWLGKREGKTAHFRTYLDACGVERLLVSNLSAAGSFGGGNIEETPANVECLTLCREDPRLVPLYWVRLGHADSHLHAFAGALEVEPFAGAVFGPTYNGFAAEDPRLDPYMAVLGKLKKPAVFLTAPQNDGRPAEVYELAKRHPSVSFVLCGAGGETQWNEAVDVVKRAHERTSARLYLCTGRAEVDDIVSTAEAIGTERMVFGSDATFLAQCHGDQFRDILTNLRKALPAEAYAAIVGGNAIRMFQM